jgi:subtilisin family serine protease
MRRAVLALFLSLFFIILSGNISYPIAKELSTEAKQELRTLASKYAEKFNSRRGPTWDRLNQISDGPQGILNRTPNIQLIGIDERGFPIYYSISNIYSAKTVRVDELWPGEDSGYDVDGSQIDYEMMGIWDEGTVRITHVELINKVRIAEDEEDLSHHATMVAGTMTARGANYFATGMAPASKMQSYDWENDFSELASAAADGLLISNHSYNEYAGWEYNVAESIYYWYGDPSISETEDYNFGFYGDAAHDLDEITHASNSLLTCWSSGNQRMFGPGGDAVEHYVWDGEEWVISNVARSDDGGTTGYEAIAGTALAKNILTVGAVQSIPDGYHEPTDVVITSFSSMGPTDDGRIKPDLVVPGLHVGSSSGVDDISYSAASGTSMSSPCVAGVAATLQDYYHETHGNENATAATIKALLIHTAEEAGPFQGPDYKYGWGLMNARKAADLINLDANYGGRIFERVLYNSHSDSIIFYNGIVSGNVEITVVWNDPPSEVSEPALNNREAILVNDLDVRLIRILNNHTYEPYVLDPYNPAEGSTIGDNIIDNVEHIEADALSRGYYALVVSHKDSLTGGSQSYSLIINGIKYFRDFKYVHPNYLLGDLRGDGLVKLTWEHDGIVGENMDYFEYDDGEPDGETSTVGNWLGVRMSPAGPCELLEMKYYTMSNNTERSFETKIYKCNGEIPTTEWLFQNTFFNANMNGWNITTTGNDPLEIDFDFMICFKSLDSNLSLGVDDSDNGRSWMMPNSSTWEQTVQTYFIRALVRYEDGSETWISPDNEIMNLDEEVFSHFRIWVDGNIVDTCLTPNYNYQLEEFGEYSIKIDAVYEDAYSIKSDEVVILWNETGVREGQNSELLPDNIVLDNAYPNPFNSETILRFNVATTQRVSVEVYDLLGRLVDVVSNGVLNSGKQRLTWRPENISSGIYFIRINGQQGKSVIQKVMYVQ